MTDKNTGAKSEGLTPLSGEHLEKVVGGQTVLPLAGGDLLYCSNCGEYWPAYKNEKNQWVCSHCHKTI